MMDRVLVLKLVEQERDRQNQKWGFPQNNHPFAWSSILMEEVGEFSQALNDALFSGNGNLTHALTEAIHVAAVAISIVEHLGGMHE